MTGCPVCGLLMVEMESGPVCVSLGCLGPGLEPWTGKCRGEFARDQQREGG